MDEALTDWADHLTLVQGRSGNTVRGYLNDMRRLAEGITRVEDFTLTHVRSRLADLTHLAPTTRSRMVTSARLFAAHAVKRGWSDGGQVDRLIAPRIPEKIPQVYSQGEALALCDGLKARALPSHDEALAWVLVELLYGCGLRIEEACSMDVHDVDAEGMKIRVRGKGDKDRALPIGPHQLAAVTMWLMVHPGGDALLVSASGVRLGQRQARRIFQKACTTTGVPVHTPHALRHSCATHMIEGGADIRVVAEHLGHTNLDTTQRYLHVAMSRLVDVYQSAHPRERITA